MSPRRPRLTRRLVDGVLDVVNDRAPWLSEQAYRAVAAPLQWVDPVTGAKAAEARLDGVRERVAGMASTGRVPRTERRRIERDLARTREDLQRVAPRLPAVQARGLALRLAVYTEAVDRLPGLPIAGGRATRARDAVVLAGAGAGAWTGLLLPAAGTIAVEGGLVAGLATAVGVTAVRNRRARQERIGALAAAMSAVDEASRGRHGVNLCDLDQGRRTLVRRALASGRLDERGTLTLRRIDAHLDELLLRLVDGDLEADASHLVQATVRTYLPDTLEPLLALADPRARVRGRPAAVEVADQLAAIEGGLAEVAGRPGGNDPENRLFLQGEFLRSKFGEPSA